MTTPARAKLKLWPASTRELVPSMLTALGSTAFMFWIVSGSPAWAIASLAFDILDGFAARKLRARTRFGAIYDWTVDTTAAAVLVAQHAPVWLPALVLAQAMARAHGVRVSGRALATALVVLFA